MHTCTKRTRVLARAQSKSGCFTCKYRKVKCDEAKPTCRRCAKSGFVCEGYGCSPYEPLKAQSHEPAQGIPVPEDRIAATEDNLHDTDLQNRLVTMLCPYGQMHVGSNVLRRVFLAGTAVWPSAFIAINALETLAKVMKSGRYDIDATVKVNIADSYGQAMRSLSKEMATNSSNSNGLLVTCLLLAAIELLQRHRQSALKHALGGLAPSWRFPAPRTSHRSDIELILRVFDLQTLLYSKGVRLPTVEPADIHQLAHITGERVEPAFLERQGVIVLHSAHSLIAEIHHQSIFESPLGSNANPQEYIEYLQLLIDTIKTMARSGLQQKPEYPACLLVQNLCRMTVMQLRQLHAADELSWDIYLDDFQAIVKTVDALMDTSRQELQMRTPFTLQVGIIPPLELVASKCRYPSLRRRAIVLLRQAGQEGPFIGTQLANMAERCLQIEEHGIAATSRDATHISPELVPGPSDLPTGANRLVKCCTVEDNGAADNCVWPKTTSGTTTVKFVRRRQPCSAIQANVLTSSYFKVGLEFQVVVDKRLDPEIWEEWTEQLRFDNNP